MRTSNKAAALRSRRQVEYFNNKRLHERHMHDNIQVLLDHQADVGNMFYGTDRYAEIKDKLDVLNDIIKDMRGSQPRVCWGTDDCSTSMLSTCPWRIDCDSDDAIAWYNKNHTSLFTSTP